MPNARRESVAMARQFAHQPDNNLGGKSHLQRRFVGWRILCARKKHPQLSLLIRYKQTGEDYTQSVCGPLEEIFKKEMQNLHRVRHPANLNPRN